MRLILLVGALGLALLLGVLASQTPAPRGSDAPAQAFSAARAMVDVRQMAQRPHPVGSPDHARVQAYLVGRMAALGLTPQLQSGPLSPDAVARLSRSGAGPASAINIVGLLPGRDPGAPAVLLMAHYDSVQNSPGAADDAAGVAATLEAVRAIRARGPAERSLVLLLTDAEELNLDGARLFFSEHPLRDRIGAVVNLEARGGGGRAMMFETGPGNADTVALYARAAARAEGGPTSNSLAVLVYEMMPNGTDFTIARDRGIAGVNLAFIGRPAQYHSPSATPDALDQGSVQHIGAQALEAADALLRAPALPSATRNVVYGDVLGRFVIRYDAWIGWLVLGVSAVMLAVAVLALRRTRRADVSAADIGRGMLEGVWAIAAGLVLTHAVRSLAGRVDSSEAYYTLLRRLPWIEAGAAVAMAVVVLMALGGRRRLDHRVVSGLVVAAAVMDLLLGGINGLVLGAAGAAAGLGLCSFSQARSGWSSGLGLIGLALVLAVAVQAAAPGAAFLLAWPLLLASAAAAISASVDPARRRLVGLIAPAATTVVGGAWLATLAHPVFLGVGMDLPGVLAPLGFLVLMLARPLAPEGADRRFAVAAGIGLALACGLSLSSRIAEPATPANPAATAPST